MVENVKIEVWNASGRRQECQSGKSRRQERPEVSPRLRAATRMRFAALGGFEPSQARPQQAPLVGAALVVVVPSVAAWAALVHQQAPFVGAALVALAGGGHQQALWGAALVVTMTSVAAWAALNIQQASGEVAPLTMEASVAAALAARIPQPAPDGAAFVA